MSKEKSKLFREELNDLGKETKNFLTAIKFLDQRKTEKDASNLYQKLLEEPLSAFPEKKLLRINPDQELALIPFDALIQNNDHYLVEDYVVSYELSFDLNQSIIPRNQEKKLLSFAPVFNKESESKEVYRNLDDAFFEELIKEENLANSIDLLNNVTELKESKLEIENISENFKSNNWQTENYLEKEASEAKVKELDLSQYKIIHFSTHSYQNRRNPNLSAVLLSNKSKKEDGLLFASEIRALNLNADLVTLSSCESASGNLAKGEGALSLSRSFLMSGARRTLVSLWKVDDKSTRELMEVFYQSYLETGDFKAALRVAKLKLLKSENYKFPRYWAAFTLNLL
jgi:CHAT domain-containing protein